MNIFIALSQGARIGAIWAKSQTTKQILLTCSVIFYTALLMEREKKITEYYKKEDGDNPEQRTRRRS